MKMYKLKEAAEILGIHRKTLERMCHQGRISYHRLRGSNQYRFTEEDLKGALVAGESAQPNSQPDPSS